METDLLELNVAGSPGAGKSTLLEFIASRYQTQTRPQATTRAMRHGERQNFEYIFTTPTQYDRWLIEKMFLLWTNRQRTNPYSNPPSAYSRAIMNPEHFLPPHEGTRVIASQWGTTHSVEMKRRYGLKVINVYLDVEPKEGIKRLEKRDGPGPSVAERIQIMQEKRAKQAWRGFDIYIDTTKLPTEEVWDEIMRQTRLKFNNRLLP